MVAVKGPERLGPVFNSGSSFRLCRRHSYLLIRELQRRFQSHFLLYFISLLLYNFTKKCRLFVDDGRSLISSTKLFIFFRISVLGTEVFRILGNLYFSISFILKVMIEVFS